MISTSNFSARPSAQYKVQQNGNSSSPPAAQEGVPPQIGPDGVFVPGATIPKAVLFDMVKSDEKYLDDEVDYIQKAPAKSAGDILTYIKGEREDVGRVSGKISLFATAGIIAGVAVGALAAPLLAPAAGLAVLSGALALSSHIAAENTFELFDSVEEKLKSTMESSNQEWTTQTVNGQEFLTRHERCPATMALIA